MNIDIQLILLPAEEDWGGRKSRQCYSVFAENVSVLFCVTLVCSSVRSHEKVCPAVVVLGFSIFCLNFVKFCKTVFLWRSSHESHRSGTYTAPPEVRTCKIGFVNCKSTAESFGVRGTVEKIWMCNFLLKKSSINVLWNAQFPATLESEPLVL